MLGVSYKSVTEHLTKKFVSFKHCIQVKNRRGELGLGSISQKLQKTKHGKKCGQMDINNVNAQ